MKGNITILIYFKLRFQKNLLVLLLDLIQLFINLLFIYLIYYY